MEDSPSTPSLDHLMAARALGPLIRAHADQIEADRCLSSGIARALTEAGLFRMLVPRSLGGGEADLETFLQVAEELSRADGSVGWCVVNCAWQTAHVVWLSEEVAWDIVGHDPNAMLSGTIAPPGRAVIVQGGYRVTGQWRFASGCHYATWHIANAALFDGETHVLAEDGTPAFRLMLVPSAERTIIDTWQATGMRGTGSHDVAVTNVFVPADHSYWGGVVDAQRYPGPLYRIFPDLAPVVLAAVPLGMARAAIDAFIELSRVKRRQHASDLLSEHAVVQDHVGRAEASLRAARAFFYETVRATCVAVHDTGAMTAEQRTLLTLSAAHATVTAVQVMDMLWDAAGATTIFPASPLERLFRNIHTVQHNINIGAHQFETAGRAFLQRG